MKRIHEIKKNGVMHASPRQHALQLRVLIQRGKNHTAGFHLRARALDLGNAGADRVNHPPDPCCDRRDLTRRLTSAAVGLEPRYHTFHCYNDILVHNMLMQTMLVQNSSTSFTSTSSEEDRRSVDPSLLREETAKQASDSRERCWI